MRSLAIIVCAAVLSLQGCALPFGPRAVSDADQRLAATHRDRAALKLREGQLGLAIREFEKSVRINPNDAEAYFGLGEALRVKGRLDESESALRTAIKLDPEHHDAKLNLVVLALQREQWESAIEGASELLNDPTFLNPARALVNRGWAQYSLERLDAAEKDFRDAIEIDSSLYQAHLNLGIVLYARDEVVDSLRCFDRVIEILESYGAAAPRSVEAETRFRIAQARVRLGQRERALAELRLASDRGGRGRWGERAREYMGILE